MSAQDDAAAAVSCAEHVARRQGGGLSHFSIFAEDDDDPMLSSVNLVDVFLVLVVALLAAVNAQLPDYARLAGWQAVPPFTPVNGLATGNGRLNR